MIDRAHRVYGTRATAAIKGTLFAADQAATDAAVRALNTAFSANYLDLVLYQDSGAISTVILLNSGSTSGVVVTTRPSYPNTMGAELGIKRYFEIELSAEYPAANTAGIYIDFQETIDFGGGGPVYTMKRAINGPPQRQLIWPQSEYTAVQSGRAVGYKAYPSIPPPKFPGALRQNGDFQRTSPQRNGQTYEQFAVSWKYEFHSISQLIAFPTNWPLNR